MKKKVVHRTFRSLLKDWDDLFREAAEFAASVGEERLISISHSDSKGTGTVVVWYWSE